MLLIAFASVSPLISFASHTVTVSALRCIVPATFSRRCLYARFPRFALLFDMLHAVCEPLYSQLFLNQLANSAVFVACMIVQV